MKIGFKRITSVLLSVLMAVSFLPLYAFAETEAITEEKALLDSGECGGTKSDAVIWYVYDTDSDSVADLLELKGTGDIATYEWGEYPWYTYRSEITKIILDEGISCIPDNAFVYFRSLSDIELPSSITSIGESSFYSCKALESIDIPLGVTVIAYNTFGSCSSLKNVTFSNSLTEIEEIAFDASAVTDVYYDGTIAECEKIVVNSNNSSFLAATIHCIDGDYNYVYESGICGDNLIWKDYYNGNLVISGTGPMYDYDWGCSPFENKSLKSLILEEGITHIGDHAFFSIDSSGELNIPNTVMSIGKYSFSGSEFSGDLVIPDSVISIGNTAFESSKFEGELKLSNGLTSISDETFMNCSFSGTLIIPNSVTSIGMTAFVNCAFSGDLVVPNSVTNIGPAAFAVCDGIENIVLSNNLSEISKDTFEQCRSLKTIIIPESITQIGNGAFDYCEALTDIYYSGTKSQWDAITVEDNNDCMENATVHFGKFNITTATCENGSLITDKNIASLGETVTITATPDSGFELSKIFVNDVAIDGTTFTVENDSIISAEFVETKTILIDQGTCGANLTWQLTEDGVLIISGQGSMTSAPWNNHKEIITSLVLEDEITSIIEYAFANCKEISGKVIIPDTVSDIGMAAFAGCSLLEEIEIPEKVTYISEALFSNCTNLTKILLHENVTQIGDYAFERCPLTGEVELPDSISYIGAEAFNGCVRITSINIPDNLKYLGREAFSGCINLSGVLDFSSNIEKIEKEAFLNCNNLERIIIRNADCSVDITTLSIPSSVSITGHSNSSAYAHSKLYGNKFSCIEHSIVLDPYKAATCKETGVTEGSHCSICGEIFVKQEVIEATGHSYGEWIVDEESTCIEEGSKHKVCSVCDDNVVETIETTEHNWNTDYSIDKEPTSTEEGLQSIHCAYCDAVKEDSVENIPVLISLEETATVSGLVDLTYTGTALTQNITVTCLDNVLVENVDYIITYKNNIVVGTATVIIEGAGEFAGTIEKTFKIKAVPADNLTFSNIKDQAYTGSSIKPNFTVKHSGITLVNGKDYNVKYSNNKNIGKATATITMKGNYTGTKKINFNIVLGKVTGAAISKTTTSSITLKWNKVTGADGYIVYRMKDDKWSQLTKTTSLTYTNNELKSGTIYKYAIKAYKVQSKKTYTSTLVEIKTTTNPAKVTDFKTKKVSTNSVSLSWNKVSRAEGYIVYLKNTETGKWKKLGETTSLTYTHSKLKSGATYEYAVKAYKKISDKYFTSSYATLKTATTPEKVTNLNYTAKTNSIKLSWNKVSGASGYIIYRVSNDKLTQIATTTKTYYTHSNLNSGTKYKYTIKAYKTYNGKDYVSSSVSISTITNLTKVSGLKTSNVTKNSVSLAWSKVNGATGYIVYRRNEDDSKWVKLGSTTKLTYTNKSLKAYTKYKYAVKAYKTTGDSEMYGGMTSIQITTLAPTLKAPVISVSQYEDEFINVVEWGKISGASGYQVYRKIGEDGSWKRVKTINDANTTSYKSNVTHGKYVYWKVRAFYKGVSTVYSQYSNIDDLMISYTPKYSVLMSKKTDTKCSVVVMMVDNKGEATMKIYADGARLYDNDYEDYDRKLKLVDPVYENDKIVDLKEISYINIKPGESKMVSFIVVGTKTWYDKYSKVRFKFKYDNMSYIGFSSYYYGSRYYEA